MNAMLQEFATVGVISVGFGYVWMIVLAEVGRPRSTKRIDKLEKISKGTNNG